MTSFNLCVCSHSVLLESSLSHQVLHPTSGDFPTKLLYRILEFNVFNDTPSNSILPLIPQSRRQCLKRGLGIQFFFFFHYVSSFSFIQEFGGVSKMSQVRWMSVWHLPPSNFGRLMCKRVEKASLGNPIKVDECRTFLRFF